jgi:hypothetical protein
MEYASGDARARLVHAPRPGNTSLSRSAGGPGRPSAPPAVAVLAVILVACGAAPRPDGPSPQPTGSSVTAESSTRTSSSPADATSAYLARLDLAAVLDAGADYAAPVRPTGDPNAFVAALHDRYRGVDRVAVLREVFRRLTAGPTSETEKERAVLTFVQHLSVHDFASPLMGIPIFDPLILFDVHAMDCQKDSRLIADLYRASGYDSRLVDFYGHAVAEVRYEGMWHYADADMFGGGQVATIEGHIPSVAELAHHPELLDRMSTYLENDVLASYPGATGKNGGGATITTYPSAAYFSRDYFAGNPGYPAYLARKAMPMSSPDPDLAFGWTDPSQLERSPATDVSLSDLPERASPGPPSIDAVVVASGSIRITVSPSGEALVAAYRVFVSSVSRGWEYGRFLGSPAAAADWANSAGWAPSMYERLFQVPGHDVRSLDASTRNIRIAGLAAGTYFVSVMPMDAYGRQVGRDLAPLSNELRVTVPG